MPSASDRPPGDIRQRLAQSLRRRRAALGWSQEAAAHEAGLHSTYLSDLERGARNPTITVVDKLARALGTTPGALLDAEGAGGEQS